MINKLFFLFKPTTLSANALQRHEGIFGTLFSNANIVIFFDMAKIFVFLRIFNPRRTPCRQHRHSHRFALLIRSQNTGYQDLRPPFFGISSVLLQYFFSISSVFLQWTTVELPKNYCWSTVELTENVGVVLSGQWSVSSGHWFALQPRTSRAASQAVPLRAGRSV